MSDNNDLDWDDHVEGQLVDVEGKVEDAIRACEHQNLRSELVGLYSRIMEIQFRYYDNVDIDTTLTDDEDDDVEITDEMKEEMEEMSRKAVEDNIFSTVKMYGAGSTDPADEIECNLESCDCESSESFEDYFNLHVVRDDDDEFVGTDPGDFMEVNSSPDEILDETNDEYEESDDNEGMHYNTNDVTDYTPSKEWIDDIIEEAFEDRSDEQ